MTDPAGRAAEIHWRFLRKYSSYYSYTQIAEGSSQKKVNSNHLIVCFTASWGQRARLPKALPRTIESLP